MQRRILATALTCAIVLSACRSTAPGEQAAVPPPAPPPPPADAVADGYAAQDAQLDSVIVTGSRLRAEEAKAVRQAYAPAPASIAYRIAPPAPVYAQPANTENYAERDDNPVQRVAEQPVSTFSIDVDTGSYSNVRRMIRQGTRPPADAVRAEEFINYFDYGHPGPASLATPFRATTEVARAPWNAKRQLLMVGIKGFDVPKAQLPPANLVFLLDTSGSMNSPDKLPLPKPSVVRAMPDLRWSATIVSSEPPSTVPTLKSPSVARITRFTPSSTKARLAIA